VHSVIRRFLGYARLVRVSRLSSERVTKGSFPSEDAARKLIYVAVQNVAPAWTKTRNVTAAPRALIAAFKTAFGDRVPNAI
jgi:transposase-like protein